MNSAPARTLLLALFGVLSGCLLAVVRETRMTIEQHLQLLFVVPGRDVERPVASMPGELWTATVTVLQQASLHTAVGHAA